jgi:hypothetical protein
MSVAFVHFPAPAEALLPSKQATVFRKKEYAK